MPLGATRFCWMPQVTTEGYTWYTVLLSEVLYPHTVVWLFDPLDLGWLLDALDRKSIKKVYSLNA